MRVEAEVTSIDTFCPGHAIVDGSVHHFGSAMRIFNNKAAAAIE